MEGEILTRDILQGLAEEDYTGLVGKAGTYKPVKGKEESLINGASNVPFQETDLLIISNLLEHATDDDLKDIRVVLPIDKSNFQIQIGDHLAKVTKHTVAGQDVLHIAFGSDKVPLKITKAKTKDGDKWVSVPQGRQQEAEVIGGIIEAHLKGG